MKSLLILAPFFFLALVPVVSQTFDDELKLGVAAYKDGHYDQAIQHFEKATQLDPGHINAHLYLATACVSQYIPGVNTDDNKAYAEEAIAHYQTVLDLNSNNTQKVNSAKGIAYLYLNMKSWDEARRYYQMASDLDPNDPEPHYSIGVIDWSQCYQPRMEARAQLEMHPDEHVSSRRPEQRKICNELQAKNGSIIEDGISQLDRAIQLRPGYDDAMAYMNLMYRERADLECDDPAARSRDLKTADEWVDKALAAKKAKAERAQAPK